MNLLIKGKEKGTKVTVDTYMEKETKFHVVTSV
jgi:hypothetical protein